MKISNIRSTWQAALLLTLMTVSASVANAGEIFGEPVTIADRPRDGAALAMEETKLYTGASDMLRCYETAADPLHPKLLGEIRLPSKISVRQLAVRDGLVGVAAREGQLTFFDFKDPAKPRFLSRYDCCELATGIDFGGNVCFCGQRHYGVEFIDVSDPEHPAHIAIRPTPESQSVLYRDGYCYSGEWGVGKATVFDCHDMSKITKVDEVDLYGVGDGVWAYGNYLYAATGHHSKHRPTEGLKTYVSEDFKNYGAAKDIAGAGAGHGLDIFSIADPAHPKRIGRVDYPPFHSRSSDFWTVRTSGDGKLAFAAQSYNGLFAVDVSDPAKPLVADRFTLPCKNRKNVPSAVIAYVAVGDGVIYIAAYEHGIVAVPAKGATRFEFKRGVAPTHTEAREPYPTAAKRFTTWAPKERGQVHGVAVSGDRVWAACGDAGLHALKIIGDRLVEIERVPDIAQAYDCDLKGDHLVVAEGLKGWAFYKIGADVKLTETSRIRKSLDKRDFGFWTWMLSERWTVLSPRNGDYLLVDTADFAKPVLKGTFPLGAPGWSKFLSDGLIDNRWLCYLQGNNAAAWVDVTAEPNGKSMPVIRSSPKNRGGTGLSCCVFGDKNLVMRREGYSFYQPGEFSDEMFPIKTGLNRNDRFITGMPRTDGRYVLVSDRSGQRVALFDMQNPKSAKCLWLEHVEGYPESGVVTGGRVFIPCGFQGLLMTRTK